jgi:predicted house-cleaning noncanonical NTP pyrophosphatase (MazG superfamily)
LTEEVNEFIESDDLEELADILEVLSGIIKQKNTT